MEYKIGTSLLEYLQQPTESNQDTVMLAPEVNDTKVDLVYEQITDYLLQLSQLDFTTIGAIIRTSSDEWIASERLLTCNVDELAFVVSQYPTSDFATGPFKSARYFLQYRADEHLVHLHTQRNLVEDREDAKKRFIAHHCFAPLT
jgi:hypothetical protein